jgi:hypothetical protein
MRETKRAVHRWLTGALLWGTIGLSACTAAHPPIVSRSSPTESVPHGAPDTLAEVQVAREELTSARHALDAYEYERARCLAEQAARDAQVGEARAGTEHARWIARDVRLSSEALQAVATRLAVAF